jgi:hypothetical protein
MARWQEVSQRFSLPALPAWRLLALPQPRAASKLGALRV